MNIEKKISVKLTFTEAALGLSSSNHAMITGQAANKGVHPGKVREELRHVQQSEDKNKTVFPRSEDGTPFFWDYQIKGFCKDAAGMLSRTSDGYPGTGSSESSKLKNYKKDIDGLIFVEPRKIKVTLAGPIGVIERPLRITTGNVEKVTVAVSETIPAGSTMEFTFLLVKPSLEAAVMEWLDYGELRGLSQWRNAGWGKFKYVLIG
jgi:hypothetical protein